MTLLQLQYFLRICECGSFSRAAESLYVSQPTLSVAVHQLETEFNVLLFVRNHNTLQLTEEGKSLREDATAILRIYDKINEDMQNYSNQKTLINIGFPQVLSYGLAKLFGSLETEFKEQHPEITLVFKEGTYIHPSIEMLNEGAADIIFSSSLRMINSGLYGERVSTVPIKMYVSKENSLATKKAAAISEIEDKPLITTFSSGAVTYKMISNYCIKNNHPLDQRYKVTQLSIIREMVENNNAIVLALQDGSIDGPGICHVDLKPPVNLDVCMCWNTKKPVSNALAALIDYIRRYYDSRTIN